MRDIVSPDRRTFLKTTAAVTAGGSLLAGCSSGGSSDSPDDSGGGGGNGGGGNGGGGSANLDSWFENTGNYDGVVDETGSSEVTVTVGAEGNSGPYAFDPAAIRVDTGTTVVWEWSGAGGSHDVNAEDGSFESELVGDAGHTFEHTFDSAGTYKYVCTPHESMGMKGAVVVE